VADDAIASCDDAHNPETIMPTKPWFPTYVYDSPLLGKRSGDFARSFLDECLKVREQDTAGQIWCRENYPAGYTSYGTMRTLNRVFPNFRELQRKIWPHVQRFTRRLDMDLREASLAMTDCWVNIMSREAVHPLHVHPGAVVSGTFYVSTPPGCSAIRFDDPRPGRSKALAPPRFPSCRPENREQVSYAAEAGKVILFESWLGHEVPRNPTLEERVSISFNYQWV
jgi:uncharacterized protein (TIGR02466 family)